MWWLLIVPAILIIGIAYTYSLVKPLSKAPETSGTETVETPAQDHSDFDDED